MPYPDDYVAEGAPDSARPLGSIPNGALALLLHRIGATRARVEAHLDAMVDAENDLHDIVDDSAARVDHVSDAGTLDARWAILEEVLTNSAKPVRS
jgi:hypothetical protein